MTFQDFYTELMGQLPGLSPFLAQRFISRAFRDICDSGRQWSFQFIDGAIVPPSVVTAGTVAITQGNAVVVANATMQAAIGGLTNPTIVFRQIRFGGTALYNIVAYLAPNITLDRPVADTSNAASTYQLYQAYYPAPATDLVRWVSVEDPVNDYDVDLDHTRQELDAIDPGRQSQDMPVWMVAYKVGSLTAGPGVRTPTPVPYYELWPHPVSQNQLLTYAQIHGTSLLVNAGDIPPTVIPDDVIVQRALGWHAYPWAMANAGRLPELKGQNWGYLITDAKNAYQGEAGTKNNGLLNDAKRMDDETFNRSRIYKRPRKRGFPGIIDSRFFQTHGVPVIGGG